jgi:hypothetical protein
LEDGRKAMTTDPLESDTGVADPWEGGVADDGEEGYRCGCADCRALRGLGKTEAGGAGRRDG